MANQATLVGSTFTNAWTGGTANAAYQLLQPSTIAPVSQTNGIEVLGGSPRDPTRTFVGEAWLNSSQRFSDSTVSGTGCNLNVASRYNPIAKSASNTFTANHTVGSTSFAEIGSEIECDFVDLVVNSEPRVVNWSFVGSSSNDTLNDGANTALGFDGSATEAPVGYTVAAANQKANASSAGAKGGLTTGHHIASVYGQTISGGTATWLGGTTPAGAELNISLPQ